MIDMKESRDAPLDTRTDIPRAFPPDGAEAALDRDRVQIWDVTWPSGRAVPLHVHPTDTVLVFLEGGTISTTGEDGAVDTTTYSEKDIAFLPAGTAHTTRVVTGVTPGDVLRAEGLSGGVPTRRLTDRSGPR